MTYPGSGTYPGSSTYPGTSGAGGGSGPPPAVVTVPGQANPNWPLVHYEVDFNQGAPNTPGTAASSVNAAFRRMTVKQCAISRGRQYELDQVQAGSATMSVVDPLEYLSFDNSAGPWWPINPYRATRISAVWPNQPGSGNILAGLGVAADVSFENGTIGGWSAVSGTTATNTTAAAWTGTHSLAVSQTGSGSGFGVFQRFSTAPTVIYTFSCEIQLGTATSVSAKVQRGDGSTITSSSVSGAGWKLLTLTWTSQDTRELVTVVGGSSGTWNMDAFQLEFGSTASTFTTSGPTTYTLFTGYVERLPTQYEMNGVRALRPLVAVDALAMMSRIQITQSYAQRIAMDNPLLFIPYNDNAPGNMVLRNTTSVNATNAASVVAVRGIQDNSTSAPNGTASWGGDAFLDGTPALSLTSQNAAGVTTPKEYMSVDIPHTFSYPVNTTGATFEGWIRWTNGHFHGLLFGYNSGNTGTLFQETWASTSNSFVGLVFTTTGLTFYANTLHSNGIPASTGTPFSYAGSSGAFAANDPSNFVGDGQWHYYSMTFARNGSNNGWVLRVQVDNHTATIFPSPGATGYDSFNFNQITTEALLTRGDKQAKVSVANVAYYPQALSSSTCTDHYNYGVGHRGEKSGTRVSRLLAAYWAGAVNVAPGQLSMAEDYAYDPGGNPSQARALLDVLQEIQESERGLVYADRNGTVVFEDRTSRASSTPTWVLGENPAGASPTEYPYSDYQADYDPTYTFSQANLTRPGNANYPVTVNATTAALFGQRVLTQQVQCVDDFALGQAATFYLTRYSSPRTRINKITLNPAANPNLWPVVLGLEISQQLTITRRTIGATVSGNYFVEKIDHRVDPSTGTWLTDLQLSPVFTSSTKVWVLGTGALGSATTPVY